MKFNKNRVRTCTSVRIAIAKGVPENNAKGKDTERDNLRLTIGAPKVTKGGA